MIKPGNVYILRVDIPFYVKDGYFPNVWYEKEGLKIKKYEPFLILSGKEIEKISITEPKDIVFVSAQKILYKKQIGLLLTSCLEHILINKQIKEL